MPVADGVGARSDEERKPVERALGAHLLHDPDARVDDEDAEEKRVAPVAEGERERAEDGDDQVEDGEDVAADDACVGPARLRRARRAALLEQPARLGLGQPGRRCAPGLAQLLGPHQARSITRTLGGPLQGAAALRRIPPTMRSCPRAVATLVCGLVLVALPSVARAAVPPDAADPCVKATKDSCGTAGVGFCAATVTAAPAGSSAE